MRNPRARSIEPSSKLSTGESVMVWVGFLGSVASLVTLFVHTSRR